MESGPVLQADLDKEALEFFFNSVDEQFAILGPDGSVLRANGAFRRLVAPAGGADNVVLSAYLTQESSSKFNEYLSSLEPLEAVKDLRLSMRVGWNERLVLASLCRSTTNLYYFSAVDITNEAKLEQRHKETDEALAQLELIVGIGRWKVSKTQAAYWSPGMFRMFGMEPNGQPLKYSEFSKWMSVEDEAKLKLAFGDGHVVGRTSTVTCKLNCPDGQVRVIELAGSPHYLDDGTIDGMSGVALNKTNNINALKSSMQIDTSAKAFLEYAPMGVAILDVAGNISLVNQALAQQLNKTEAYILGTQVKQLWPSTPQKIHESVAEALNGKTIELSDVQIVMEEGSQWVDWICAPWKNLAGEICGAICIVKDVTIEVNRIRRTEASHNRMEYGLSLSSMMVWEIDLIKKTLEVEGDWSPFFNCKPNLSELSKSLFKSAHPEDATRVSKAWKQHVCAGAPVQISFRKNNAVGREIWVAVASRQEMDETGRPVRMIGSMRDITISQKTDYLLAQAEERIAAKNRHKAIMVAEVGRSVANQVQSMKQFSDALKRTSISEEQSKLLGLLDTSAEIVSEALHSMERFATLHSSPLKSETSEFNVSSLVEMCVTDLRNNLLPKSLQIELRQNDSMDGTYIGHPEKISEVIDLALQRVTKDCLSENVVEIASEIDNSGEGICLFSIDIKIINGGADQLNTSLVELKSGVSSELELATIHGFVELLKGSIFIANENDVLTRVLIELPITQEFERVQSPKSGTNMKNQKGISVLVAEDNPLNRRVLELLAMQMEIDISFVENGEEAIEAVRSESYDAVIMDTQMPILSGIAAIRAIRKRETVNSCARIPIIAAIPHMSFSKVREAMAAGADDCIAKPISQEDLVTHLSELSDEGWELPKISKVANG